jgi:hypothetical protein
VSEQDDVARRLLEGIEAPPLPVNPRCPSIDHEFTDATVVNQLGDYVAIIYCVKCGTWSRLSL